MSAFVQPTGGGKNKILELYRTTKLESFYEGTTICETEIPNIERYNKLFLIWRRDGYNHVAEIPVNEIANHNDTTLMSEDSGDEVVSLNLNENVLRIYSNGNDKLLCEIGTVFFLA